MNHAASNHHHTPDYGIHEKTFSRYLTGFLLCIILTLIPFYAVIHHSSHRDVLLGLLLMAAVLQFLTQVICFLGLHNQSKQGKMHNISFVFAGIVTFVIIGGSIWIMTNLNYFMMH